MTIDAADAAFIRESTRLTAPACVPEVRLHLAEDVTAVWEGTEARSGAQLPPPFWAFAWAGGQALARYTLDNPELVAGRTVLDVAAGGGVAAVAAAVAGAGRVIANDIDPLAVAAVRLNAEVNGVAVDARLGDVLDSDGGDAELVLAGDVCYSREMTARVVGFLERVTARGARVLLGDPGRAYLPRERFALVAAYDVPVPKDLESVEVKHTRVLRPAWTG